MVAQGLGAERVDDWRRVRRDSIAAAVLAGVMQASMAHWLKVGSFGDDDEAAIRAAVSWSVAAADALIAELDK